MRIDYSSMLLKGIDKEIMLKTLKSRINGIKFICDLNQ